MLEMISHIADVTSAITNSLYVTAEYGPCFNDSNFLCEFKPKLKDYRTVGEGRNEEVVFEEGSGYRSHSEWRDRLKDSSRLCQYIHQRNIAMKASHSVFNYPMFFGLMMNGLGKRELLVLDEAHLLETEIVGFRGLSISRNRLRKFLPNLKFDNHGYDIMGWIDFLRKLKEMLLEIITPITDQVQVPVQTTESGMEIIETEPKPNPNPNPNISNEVYTEITEYIGKLKSTLENISSNPDDWIVSEIKLEGGEVVRVLLKPLDVSPYCKSVFGLCSKSLMMSGTILDPNLFCQMIGLDPEKVKYIPVPSDFPLQNRPLYPLDIAFLNKAQLQNEEVQRRIALTTDKLMTLHKDWKGIIHITSYPQLNFIKQNISRENRERLLETNPEKERDEVIEQHCHYKPDKPTVLI